MASVFAEPGTFVRLTVESVDTRQAMRIDEEVTYDLKNMNAMLRRTVDSGGWRSRLFGRLSLWSPPRAGLLGQPTYITTRGLWALALLGLLPLLSGALRALRRHHPSPTRRRAASSASEAVLDPQRLPRTLGRTIEPPRLRRRLLFAGCGLIAALGVWVLLRSTASGKLELFRGGNVSVAIQHACLTFGSDPDPALRTAQIAAYIADLSTGWTDMPDALRSTLTFERTLARRCAEPGVLGISVVEVAPYWSVLVAGWPLMMAALLAAVPLLTGLRDRWLMARRRRRGLCARCTYPLHGLPEPRCPECGLAFAVAGATA